MLGLRALSHYFKKSRPERPTFAALIFEKSPDAYFITENRRIIDCNPAMERLLGAPRERILGLQPSSMSPERQPDDQLSRDAIKQFSSQFNDRHATRFEWTHQTLDGAPLPVTATTFFAQVNGRQVTVSFWQDMREVEKLRAAERRTQAEIAAAAAAQRQVVEQLAAKLKALAAGALTARLDTSFPPDYEALRQDFNSAVETLRAAMRGIAANAASVRAGAQEITTASDDLSRRTEHQAATLEQTAAALDSITGTVQKTAEGAQAARAIVTAATEGATHSGDVVRQAIEAMGRIEESSRQIGNIIGVIDEIAFQTNLLALNAGIEAARAGDAGRGFAVVATEVRALAQRSADSAREIKALISTSTKQVDVGVQLVGETGTALVEIAAQIAKLNGLVAQIAAAAHEQSAGLREVNVAVNQMDQVTQQNAAMVEQSTAASHGLAGEAQELARLVGQFQLDSTAPLRDPNPLGPTVVPLEGRFRKLARSSDRP
jgi:methyl-accepting chemotaxis protein